VVLGYIAALLFAALAPAAAAWALSRNAAFATLAFNVALGHAVLLGLPLTFMIGRQRINVASCTAAGFLIGAVPWSLLAWPWHPGRIGSASVNGSLTVVNVVPTAFGWLRYAESVVMFGAYGALGGLVFWMILRASKALHAEQAQRVRPSAVSSAALLALLAKALSGSVLEIPAVTRDRSCHNPLRDGRDSLAAVARIHLNAPPDEWKLLAEVFDRIGRDLALSFRNTSRVTPGVVQILHLSLCSESGVLMMANEQHWIVGEVPAKPREIPLAVYETKEASGWRIPARALVAALEERWPGKVTFSDERGRTIPKPAELRGAPQPEAPL
jgi:hypothetical protein